MIRPAVNFVVPYDDALIARLRQDDPDRIVRERDPFLPVLSGGGPSAWCYLTFVRLRDLGCGPIRLSNRIEPDCINVAHTDTLRHTPDYARGFIVDTRADHSRRLFAHFSIVQNRDQLAANSAWIHHWPQPGLIGRSSPIARIERVGYIGQPHNGNLASDNATWEAMLASQGYTFAIPESDSWHELGDYDALVAIRSFNHAPHSKKPASKLLNAWRAGIPLIGGHDSAYAQVGTPGEDYLVAASPDEVLGALDRLRAEPDLRERIVANGRARAAEYSDKAIAGLWIETLEGPIADRFARWRSHRLAEGLRARALKAADEGLIQAKQWVRRLTGAGPRT